MIELALVCVAAFLTSLLTFFSGFGLGTLLLPVFSLFFSVPIAVALTAVVHLLNNLFKLLLVGRGANPGVIARFGLPALLASFLGARLLVVLGSLPPLFTYPLFGVERTLLPVKSVVALLMIGFALLELLPRFRNLTFPVKLLPLGGLLSGFFGGLSGHQGALRSSFLINCGLSREEFIASGVAIACLVDLARISVYGRLLVSAGWGEHRTLLVAATLCAFFGSLSGSRLIRRVTLRGIQLWVAALLIGIAIGLATGLL